MDFGLLHNREHSRHALVPTGGDAERTTNNVAKVAAKKAAQVMSKPEVQQVQSRGIYHGLPVHSARGLTAIVT
jgi:hypothetical protein